MTSKSGFLDTNVFLQFQPLDQIDWSSLLGCDHVVLVVTAAVIRQLNKHKDASISPRLRDRAASALKKLYAYSESSEPVIIHSSVELRFNTQEPLLDFVSEGLSRELPFPPCSRTERGRRRRFWNFPLSVSRLFPSPLGHFQNLRRDIHRF